MKHRSNNLIITRLFDAHRDLVWKAWTDPSLFKKWWGPKGFTAPQVNIDFRVGGVYLHCMRSPDGKDYWSTGVYKEIEPKQKIVATDSFADQHGNIVSASYYGMDGFPVELLVTVSFEAINNLSTKMTIIHVGLPEGEMHDQCHAGWNESFDKLEEVLRKEK